jgi:hypothetical protein
MCKKCLNAKKNYQVVSAKAWKRRKEVIRNTQRLYESVDNLAWEQYKMIAKKCKDKEVK